MPQHALAIVLGSLFAYFGNELPDRYWSALVPIVLLFCYCCPAYRFILLLSAAYLWSSAAFHHHLEHRLNSDFDNRITLMRGIFDDIHGVKRERISLSLNIIEIERYAGAMPRRARLNWYQDERLPLAGELWEFEVKLRQPTGTMNPAGSDFEAWQFTNGIDVAGYIRNSSANRKLEDARWWNPNYWRTGLAASIDHSCDRCEHRGLIKALALGYRGDIPATQKRLLQSGGIAHLLAISGLHIGTVSLLFYGLGRHCWRLGLYRCGLNRIQAAWLMAIVAATCYAALAGFSLPTTRALIMFAALGIALLTRNRINLSQSVALALSVIIIIDPRSVGSVAFWLSFCALLVIAFVQFRLPGNLPWWQRLLALQCCFSLLFAPLGILIFGQFYPAGLLANIVSIPVVSFAILPLVLAGCLLVMSGLPGGGMLFNIADSLLRWLLGYVNWLIDSGLQSSAVFYPSLLLLMVLVALLALLLPRSFGVRGVAMLSLAVAFTWHQPRLQHGAYELVVFDVGMGTALILRTRNHSLVYDLGPGRSGERNPVDWALLPFMLRHGIRVPDLLVISHVDQDHSGGLHSFRDLYQPSSLLSGTPEELKARFELQHSVRSCHDYPEWRWDGVDFSFLVAGQSKADSGSNNRSCVLRVNGDHRVLIPGDIETVKESELLSKYGAALHADVLVAPHHGSSTSSSQPFLDRVRPDHVVFTLSRNNRWGFPTNEVVSRYKTIGSRRYRSDKDGAIRLRSSGGDLQVKTMRKPARRIWQRW